MSSTTPNGVPAFRVGLTHDFLDAEGRLAFGDIDIGLGRLEAAGIEWQFLPEHGPELRAADIADFDAICAHGPSISAATVADAGSLTLIARFGVGYDSVDLGACTSQGVAVTITPDGVRRPLASAAMTLVLALASRLLTKDRLVRDGRWDARDAYTGIGLTGRTLGVIGFGNVGQEVGQLARAFDMRVLAYDPYVASEVGNSPIADMTNLETLLVASDFVVVCCPLTRETFHLLDAGKLARMRPSSFLVNVARGPVIDQAALTETLRTRGIQGAGLDVFEEEPISPTDPLLEMENVIVTPHCLCWTDENFSGNGQSASASILDVAAGRVPEHIVNRDVLDSSLFKAKLSARREQIG